MMLYDVFYTDGTMDRDIPLPQKGAPGAKAVNTNWDRHVFRWDEKKNDWVLAD
jgi:hypothetical protein